MTRPTIALKLLALLLILKNITGATSESFARLERYAVNTTISNRFARTRILMDVVNEGECATVMGLTLQLPINGRVKSLTMDLSDDSCSSNGVVKTEAKALEDFNARAQQGSPAALLQAFDLFNYAIQISLPPLGATRVELELEELLQRKRGKFDISIPLFPGLEVEELVMDLSIQEGSGVEAFDIVSIGDPTGDFLTQSWDYVDNHNNNATDANATDASLTDASTSSASAHLEVFNVPESGRISDEILLPRMLRGSYDMEALPEEGLIIPDSTGQCFVHLFNPSQALISSLPRNIVFVMDVSRSMEGQKMKDAQSAFVAMLNKLTDRDYFTIHSFSDAGTEDYFGPSAADQEAKDAAKAWVQKLEPHGGTNLKRAYTNGIRRVQEMQKAAANMLDKNATKYIPIVLVLTDGQASSGAIDNVKIARRIKEVNSEEGESRARLYGLAFGKGADFALLNGISMQNNGQAIRIYEDFGDASAQIETFFEGELGTLLASDLSVSLWGNVRVESNTQTSFSVFSEGSEIAVRARTRDDEPIVDGSILGAITYAYTTDGIQNWTAQLNAEVGGETSDNECLQSFAHAKIADLMRFREAAAVLGNDMSEYATHYMMGNGVVWNTASNFGSNQESQSTSKHGNERRRQLQQPDFDLANRAEAQAVKLALEAGVVWPGLTAMVTKQKGSCAVFNNPDGEVCFEGDSISPPESADSRDEDSGPDVGAASAAWSIEIWYATLSSTLLALTLQLVFP